MASIPHNMISSQLKYVYNYKVLYFKYRISENNRKICTAIIMQCEYAL